MEHKNTNSNYAVLIWYYKLNSIFKMFQMEQLLTLCVKRTAYFFDRIYIEWKFVILFAIHSFSLCNFQHAYSGHNFLIHCSQPILSKQTSNYMNLTSRFSDVCSHLGEGFWSQTYNISNGCFVKIIKLCWNEIYIIKDLKFNSNIIYF